MERRLLSAAVFFMTELMLTYGNAGLFLTAFLAATLLPLSSEALLIYLVHQTGDPWMPLFWASAGNVLGSMVNYGLGYYGESFIFYRLLKLKPQTLAKARHHYKRAQEISKYSKVGPYISLATTICVTNQNDAEYRKLWKKALKANLDRDPTQRLLNTL